jgi:hypothetical protein
MPFHHPGPGPDDSTRGAHRKPRGPIRSGEAELGFPPAPPLQHSSWDELEVCERLGHPDTGGGPRPERFDPSRTLAPAGDDLVAANGRLVPHRRTVGSARAGSRALAPG